MQLDLEIRCHLRFHFVDASFEWWTGVCAPQLRMSLRNVLIRASIKCYVEGYQLKNKVDHLMSIGSQFSNGKYKREYISLFHKWTKKQVWTDNTALRRTHYCPAQPVPQMPRQLEYFHCYWYRPGFHEGENNDHFSVNIWSSASMILLITQIYSCFEIKN